MLPWLSWIATLTLCAGYAIWKGEWPERTVAGACLLAYVVSLVIVGDTRWAGLKWSMIGVASVLSVILLMVALAAKRFWPLPAAAVQILSTVVLLMRALDPTIRPLAYYFAEKLFDYAGLLILAAGTYVEVVRRGERVIASDK